MTDTTLHPTLLVRMLEAGDASEWARLRYESLIAHPLSFGAAVPDSIDEIIAIAADRVTPTAELATFGAFDGERLVGTAGILRNKGAKERHKAVIWGMYVTAAHRRTGVAARLLDAAIEHGRQWKELRMIHLTVSESAPEARRLYERAGFRAWGVEPMALCHDGECVDETYMVLELARA